MISRRKSQVYWVLVPVLCVCVCVCVCVYQSCLSMLQEYVTSPSFDILEHTASRQVIGGTYHSNRHVISNDNQNSSEILLTKLDNSRLKVFRTFDEDDEGDSGRRTIVSENLSRPLSCF